MDIISVCSRSAIKPASRTMLSISDGEKYKALRANSDGSMPGWVVTFFK